MPGEAVNRNILGYGPPPQSQQWTKMGNQSFPTGRTVIYIVKSEALLHRTDLARTARRGVAYAIVRQESRGSQ